MSSSFGKNISSVAPDDVSILTGSLLPISPIRNYDDAITSKQITFGVEMTNTAIYTTAGTVAETVPPATVWTGRYHSTCPSRFIPELARNMSWNDPFYTNDNDVIAVFDLNPATSCGRLLSWPGFCYIFVGGLIVLQILDFYDDYLFYSLFGYWLFLVIVWIPVGQCLLQLERYRIRRGYKHVAIARRGIYIDETSGVPPNNLILVRRTRIKYEEIEECYVTSFLATYCYADVVIRCKKGLCRNRRIHGNFDTHKLVDIVDAMIAASSATPNFVADNAVMGTIVE